MRSLKLGNFFRQFVLIYVAVSSMAVFGHANILKNLLCPTAYLVAAKRELERRPRGNYTEVTRLVKNSNGTTYFKARLYAHSPGAGYEGQYGLRPGRLGKAKLNKMGFTLSATDEGESFISRGPHDSHTVNQNIQKWNEANPKNPIGIRSYDFAGSGEVPAEEYFNKWVFEGALPLASDGSQYFHDRSLHIVNAITIPEELLKLHRSLGAALSRVGKSKKYSSIFEELRKAYITAFDSLSGNLKNYMTENHDAFHREWVEDFFNRARSEIISKIEPADRDLFGFPSELTREQIEEFAKQTRMHWASVPNR
jgi:hypothetical protein